MDFSKTTKSPVVLKEENKLYALDPSKEMTGYLKLEHDGEKCLIIALMENVKFFPKGEYVYTLVLAGTKNEKRCYHMIGNISLSTLGNGEASFRVNPADLDGSGSSLQDFSVAIIAAMSTANCREALHPVLKGVLPQFTDALQDVDEPTPYAPAAVPAGFNGFYNRYIMENCINIAKEQDQYADIVPFAKDTLQALWKKITAINKFPMVAPGSSAPMKKYGHFLWGYNDTHYFLGVPGRYFTAEQPDEGKSGFVSWLPIQGMEKKATDPNIPIEERRKNIYGYWIAAVNRYNGQIEEIPLIDD